MLGQVIQKTIVVTLVLFALPAWGTDVPFTERVISTAAAATSSVFATDVDGDGDTDVLSALWSDDKIVWYESDGGSPPTFTERVISDTAGTPHLVFATDVDGDGDTDVLSASFGHDKIAWYESDGGSPPSFTERMISTTADGAFSVFATDLDGDGDIDVLSASQFDDKIAWYESDGGLPPSFTERVISTAADRAISVFATDIDGDGNIDVLSASLSDDKIAWYENDGGSPPTFTDRVISTTANGAWSVFATDIDGDGDIDVLSASLWDSKIAWYESDGGSPPTFTERVISTTAMSARSVFATDLDGDGDTDVLSASYRDDKIAWYENTTPPIVCGDGVVEGAEECDDGGESATCDADCTFAECGDETLNVTAGEDCEPPGSECCDDSCHFASDGTSCPNDFYCDGDESCQASECVDGPDPCIDQEHCDEDRDLCLSCIWDDECDDEDPCTDDACVENECVHTPRPGCEAQAHLDIKPGSCPNPVNPRSKGVVPVAVVGSESFDVTQIDIDSLALARDDGVGEVVTPLTRRHGPWIATEDVATPFDGELCDCHELGADGIDDLSLKFSTPELAEALELGSLPRGASVMLTLSGSLLDRSEFEASDCIVIPGRRAAPAARR